MTLTENPSVIKNDTQRPQKHPHHQKLAIGTHFHTHHGNKTTPVFLIANGDAPWLKLQSSVSLLSCGQCDKKTAILVNSE